MNESFLYFADDPKQSSSHRDIWSPRSGYVCVHVCVCVRMGELASTSALSYFRIRVRKCE